MKSHKINLDDAREISLRSVRRAYVFMGLGVNASRDENFIDFHLQDFSGIRLMPENVSKERIAEFKSEFRLWVIGNGIREVVDGFSLFLSRIYYITLLVQVTKGTLEHSELEKIMKRFEKKSVVSQSRYLNVNCSISYNFLEYFETLRVIRNCLSHRNGLVTKDDANCDKGFMACWHGLRVFVKKKDGSEIDLPLDKKLDVLVEEGESVLAQFIRKEKLFPVNARIELGDLEMQEVLMMVKAASDQVIESTLEHLKREGVRIERTSKN